MSTPHQWSIRALTDATDFWFISCVPQPSCPSYLWNSLPSCTMSPITPEQDIGAGNPIPRDLGLHHIHLVSTILCTLTLIILGTWSWEHHVSYICQPWFQCTGPSLFADYSYPISAYLNWMPDSLSHSECIPVPPSESVREWVHAPPSTLYHLYTLPPTSMMLIIPQLTLLIHCPREMTPIPPHDTYYSWTHSLNLLPQGNDCHLTMWQPALFTPSTLN